MPEAVHKQSFHYLPPSVLDTLRNVEMIARELVEGTLAGLHRSPYVGFSSEFSEYRKYVPGDPVKFLDWHVFAKTDRYYIKQFHEETNTRCYVLLDVSNSMALGAAGQQKFNYCCYLAAAFMYLVQRQRDAVGLFTYSDAVQEYFPAKGSYSNLRNLLSHLEGLEPTGPSQAAKCFHRIAEEIPRRSLVLIFSDFFDLEPGFLQSLEHFRFNQSEVILFQVLDSLERDFPFQGLVEFEDKETGEIIEVESADYRDSYLGALGSYNAELKANCDRMQVSFEALDTATPFERALLAYFYKREKLF